jgi:hypothetical protein
MVLTTGLVLPAERLERQTSRSSPPRVRLYHDNPEHLWNRLHASLFVRVAADGREYGTDRGDPLLWIGSKYLLQGASHDQTVRLLKEFVDTHGEKLIGDPLKRAILQRDLWMVFDWLEGVHTNFVEPFLSPEVVEQGAAELRGMLATVIARLALRPEQIRTLSDNYSAAALTAAVPPDMFVSGGPWVLVGRPDGPVAAQHVRDAGSGKNSVFLVLMRLPGGRAVTLKYVERLQTFNGPMWVGTGYPNPDLPQFPVGTQVALVRRALVIDAAGHLAPTKLTEQVQLRVYREIRRMTAQEFDDAHRIDENMFARAGQDFDEFTLSRQALFAGRSGGLVPLSASDRFFLTFSAQGVDEFEIGGEVRRQVGLEPARATRLCKDCHGAPGVYSFNSYLPFRLVGPSITRAARLSEISLADAERTAVAWKEQRADWRVLKPLLRR